MSMNEESAPVVLVASTMWWPLAAKLAIALSRVGCVVKAICPRGHSLRYVKHTKAIYTYRGINSLGSLERAMRDSGADIVIPCDDGVVWQLHELHRLHKELRPLIERSIGSSQMYAVVGSRASLLRTAASLGIRTSEIATISSPAELASWCSRKFSRIVLKLDRTWGGEGVHILDAHQIGAGTYTKLTRLPSLAFACKRFWVDRDPLALWAWRRRRTQVLTAQGFIAGRPANTMFFAWRGELIAMVAVEVLSAQGPTGAATIVRVIHHEEISFAAKAMAKHLELSGFHGLDFILEHKTGAAYLLELNPRCTQLGHLPLPGQGSLVEALCAKLDGAAPATHETPIESDMIAFFPQAMVWNPESRYLRRSYLDIPVDELALTRELLQEPWPRRQLVARLYHALWTPSVTRTVEFEDILIQEEP